MKNKKDFGVIIQFDDKEYSEEEIEFLWWRISRESTLKIFYDNFKKFIIKIFMKRKKEIGIKIQFDDKEYSEEEIEFLWERFISILAEAKNIEIDTKITQNLAKTIVLEVFKTTKKTRTTSNIDPQRN